MTSMTIYISPKGTLLADGSESSVGHVYYTITNGDGSVASFGFAPGIKNVESLSNPGRVTTTDTNDYLS